MRLDHKLLFGQRSLIRPRLAALDSLNVAYAVQSVHNLPDGLVQMRPAPLLEQFFNNCTQTTAHRATLSTAILSKSLTGLSRF